MRPKLPQLFNVIPSAPVTVEAIPEFQKAAATHYQTGTPDGKRPGRVSVAVSDFASRSFINDEAVAYHEGIPGHHMQLSIQQTLKGLPEFRKHGGNSAYTEGWALYAEQLGKEVGFYQDPGSDYGRLRSELFRAVRLVVDTGIHDMGWSRDQVVEYMRKSHAVDEPTIQSETDRYISWPAQACSYKLGQLKIRELRARATKQLGAKFDIRSFHDEVLAGGSLPLDVLDARSRAGSAHRRNSRLTTETQMISASPWACRFYPTVRRNSATSSHLGLFVTPADTSAHCQRRALGAPRRAARDPRRRRRAAAPFAGRRSMPPSERGVTRLRFGARVDVGAAREQPFDERVVPEVDRAHHHRVVPARSQDRSRTSRRACSGRRAARTLSVRRGCRARSGGARAACRARRAGSWRRSASSPSGPSLGARPSAEQTIDGGGVRAKARIEPPFGAMRGSPPASSIASTRTSSAIISASSSPMRAPRRSSSSRMPARRGSSPASAATSGS